MLTLDQLIHPTDRQLLACDVAEVDLACAAGLPGSRRLDPADCLRVIDSWAAWVARYTDGTIDEFRRDPGQADHCEAIFRVMAMVTVLRRGTWARYNPRRETEPDDFRDAADDFVFGITHGDGGTCASLPVLYAAVGRRLGYPLRLVPACRHLFVRWDEPGGPRFNIEATCPGYQSYPDDHYREWPFAIPADQVGTSWMLQSLTPRQEVAFAWAKRAYCWDANGRLGEATRCMASCCSICPDDWLHRQDLGNILHDWRTQIAARTPAATPALRIRYHRRHWPGLPEDLERFIHDLGAIETMLDAPGPLPEPGATAWCEIG